ncbi:hypothetical protein NQ317_002853, partial [Molorchus minor]
AEHQKLFNQPFRWLIWGTSNDSIFDDYYFGVDSRVFIAEKSCLGYDIKSLYKHGENSSNFQENHISTWKNQKGFFKVKEFSVAKNRTDLMGITIPISFVITNSDTHNHLWDYRDTHIDAISKLNWILIYHLLSFVNGTSVNIFRNTWGYKNTTTYLYSGLIGDLQVGHAELGDLIQHKPPSVMVAGTPSFFTMDRIDIVDYIAATTPTFMKFIFRAPPLSYVANVFTLPFDTYVWYSSIVLAGAILLVLYIINICEWKNPHFRKNWMVLVRYNPTCLTYCCLKLEQSPNKDMMQNSKSNSGRIATIFIFIALMFLYTSYSANIVALLQSTTESIRTLEDLLYSRISLGVEDIVYAHYYFENAEEPIRKKIYEQKIAPKGQKSGFMTVQEGIRK